MRPVADESMIDERKEELASLYVLGALEETETRDFEAALQQDQELAALVHDLSQVTVALTQTLLPPNGQTPSHELKQRILELLDAPPRTKTADAPKSQPQRIDRGKFSFMLRATEHNWQPLPIPGCSFQQLEANDRYALILLKLEPGSKYPDHHHSGSEECYVLEGDLLVAGQTIRAGDFHHADADSSHGESYSENGCTLLLVVSAQDYPSQ